jgi:molecular chaperone GrpE (heat shock protein)
MAEDPDDDGDIVRVVKRGFFWKDRVLRAEEVVIKKWKEGYLVALATPLPPQK